MSRTNKIAAHIRSAVAVVGLAIAAMGAHAQEAAATITPYPDQVHGTWSQKKETVLGFSKAVALPLAGAFGDSLSTHLVLNQSGFVERNPLVNTSGAGLVGLFILKAGVIYYLEQQPAEIRKAGLKSTAGIFNGLTANNLLLLAGASNPVALIGGALFGIFMYDQESRVLGDGSIFNISDEARARGYKFHAEQAAFRELYPN